MGEVVCLQVLRLDLTAFLPRCSERKRMGGGPDLGSEIETEPWEIVTETSVSIAAAMLKADDSRDEDICPFKALLTEKPQPPRPLSETCAVQEDAVSTSSSTLNVPFPETVHEFPTSSCNLKKFLLSGGAALFLFLMAQHLPRQGLNKGETEIKLELAAHGLDQGSLDNQSPTKEVEHSATSTDRELYESMGAGALVEYHPLSSHPAVKSLTNFLWFSTSTSSPTLSSSCHAEELDKYEESDGEPLNMALKRSSYGTLIQNAANRIWLAVNYTDAAMKTSMDSNAKTIALSTSLGAIGFAVGVPYVPGLTDNIIVGAVGAVAPFIASSGLSSRTYTPRPEKNTSMPHFKRGQFDVSALGPFTWIGKLSIPSGVSLRIPSGSGLVFSSNAVESSLLEDWSNFWSKLPDDSH